jgi:tRNA(Ile)-lysidine synthetase-like protein
LPGRKIDFPREELECDDFAAEKNIICVSWRLGDLGAKDFKVAMNQLLANAIESVPSGAWAIGVSGGADSVALLMLLRWRPDLSLHVVHLNHQTRQNQSDEDAEFVIELATRLGLPHTTDHRLRMEAGATNLPRNPSARYRRLRLALFHRVVEQKKLNGVLLAHHADDQAETILLRLLRGSGYSGLAGMSVSSVIAGLRCFRPLLGVRREDLRQWLRERDQPWREDSSNESPKYLRNRLRKLLATDLELTDALLKLGDACAILRAWEISAAPQARAKLDLRSVGDLPQILGRATARKWLLANGVSPGRIDPETIDRLLAMCLDASTPPRADFPCGVRAARRQGMIEKLSAS